MRPPLRPPTRALAVLALAVGLVATPQLLGGRGGPVGAAAERVAVEQRYPVPAGGRYTLQGRGYGHGRGMSQHGAQGAAREGLGHEEILALYYPGTELEENRRRIRVLVSADTTPDVEVVHRSGLRVRDLGAHRAYAVPTDLGATRWRLTTDARHRTVVRYRAAGSWHRWAPGGSATLAGDGEFRASGPLTLVTPAGDRRYRGALRAASPEPGSADRDTVNVLALDNYVRGVVASEMPALWEPEAVQAQAVAARSYAVWHRTRNQDRYYQVCDTTACQVYGGVGAEHPASDRAVAATARQVLTYRGDPAFTEFSASSGGWTVASEVPYQRARRDAYDGWVGNTSRTWEAPLTARAVERAYPALGRLREVRVTSRDGNGRWQGRVLRMVLDGSRADVAVTGDEFRSRFGLRSTWFRL